MRSHSSRFCCGSLFAVPGPEWRRHELATQARSLIPSVADPESSLQRIEHVVARAQEPVNQRESTNSDTGKVASAADGQRLVLGDTSKDLRRSRHFSLHAAVPGLQGDEDPGYRRSPPVREACR